MAHFTVLNRAGYQTYVRPLASEKRKWASTSNESESAECDATSTAARSKKSRPNKDKYNPKYKAEMCFGAYKARLDEAGFEQYTSDVANDWREDLVEIFSHAASKGIIKQDAAARHVIPRLVVLVPRTNEKKDELVKDFAKHYENVRRDLVVIDKIMDLGCRVDEDSIAGIRECLHGLHNTLDKGVKWRSIIPYTPLPLQLHRLRALRSLVEYSRPYNLLRDLVTKIDDIEGWLESPPASLNIPTGLIDEAMDSLREATEDKITRTSIGPDAQQMAEYQEREAKQLRLEKEEQAHQQEHARLERVQRLEAEQEQMRKDIKALELAAAKERAQESMRKVSETAALAEREKSYQNQITRNATEIGRLGTDLAVLAARQAESKKSEVTSTPLLSVGPGQLGTSMGSSFSSNQTTNSSLYHPQSSLGTSPNSSMVGSSYSQPGSFGHSSCQSTQKDDSVPMEDVQDIGIPQQHPTNFGPTGFPDPGIYIAGQSNPFGAHLGSGVPSQLLGLSDGNFKPACPKHKNGHCPVGRSCKMLHTACKFWLEGNCRYGGDCIRSHDPFFLTEATSRGQPQRSLQVDQTVIDSDSTLRPSPFSQANPFQSGRQNRTHGSQASNSMDSFGHQAPPTGPRERATIMSRMTKDGQPILSQGTQSTSKHGNNAFGQQAPPTTLRGHNAFVNGMPKRNEPTSTRSTIFALDGGDNGPGYQASSNSSRGRNAFFERITKNDQPISSQDPISVSTNCRNAFDQRDVLAAVAQGPRDRTNSKKVACKNNLKGRCNKGGNCQYAHEPCPRFLDGTCRFGEDRCRQSHDPAFLDQGSSSNNGRRSLQSPTRHQPLRTHIQQSLDDIVNTGGGKKERYGKPPQPQLSARRQPPQNHLEQSLGDIIPTPGRGRKETQTQRKPSQSETPCRWQMTPNGCTNDSCPYKHDPPKSSNPKASRGALGIPNLWSSIGNILRGNRQ